MKTPTIDAVAASWHVRAEAGLSVVEEKQLESWLAADHRHREAYELVRHDSALFERLGIFRPANGAIDPDVRLPVRKKKSPLYYYYGSALAVAAALAVGYVGWWRPAYGSVQETYGTPKGAVQRVELVDRSVMTINTDSEVRVSYSRGVRHIVLSRGEAHFEVAKNPDRPFVVSADGVAVRAVGTAFNVRIRDEGVEVVVTEGKVRVDEAAAGNSPSTVAIATGAPTLEAGQRLVVSARGRLRVPSVAPEHPSTAVIRLDSSEMAQRLSWRDMRIEFNPTPLREVVAEFNRYNDTQLKLGDEATGDILVGGAFRAADPDTFVELLESSFGVKATRFQKSIVLQHVP
jgi:transmembrane sensor